MLLEELRRGSHGTMTGFGFPEVLVAVVRRWFAGDRDGAAAVFDRYATLIRFENQALLNLPIRKVVYQRRGAMAHARCGRRACRPIPGRWRTSTTCCGGPGSTRTWPPGSVLPAAGRCGLGRPRGTAARPARYGSARIIPPSTGTIAPVTNDAAGESRNAPTRPISATSP